MSPDAAPKLREKVPGTVWKFGYGSNMSPDFMRTKKALNPLAFERTVLNGWRLSFPQGQGFDLVEPAFATLRYDPDGTVHGVSTLFSEEDARKLDKQEGGYNIEVIPVTLYAENGESAEVLNVEVYTPKTRLADDHVESCCSVRYRDVLVKGAREMALDPAWIEKLEHLATYTPSAETLAARATLPPPSALPAMTIAELAEHDGSNPEKAVYTSSCGYIFEHRAVFKVMWGRDITFRNILQARGINLDANDDKGRSPFPKLSQLEPPVLEYALQYRDRCLAKSVGGKPIAVLREYWEEQAEHELAGVFSGNTLGVAASPGSV